MGETAERSNCDEHLPRDLAGYEAAKTILADREVDIKDPHVRTTIPTDPLALMASFPPAFSVQAVPLREGINVVRNGRFGLSGEYTWVDYPVAHDSPEFQRRLSDVLLPVVDRELELARQEEGAERREHGAVYEARDAITKIE